MPVFRTRHTFALAALIVILSLLLAACGEPAIREDVGHSGDTEAVQVATPHEENGEHAADDHDADTDQHEESDEHAADDHDADTDQHEAGDEHTEADHDAGAEEHAHEEQGGMTHMHVTTPDNFANLSNPLADDADAIAAGEQIFQTNCSVCHGETGAGDGPASIGLDPKPAALSDSGMMAELSDSYLFWRVTEGGQMEPFNSAMPSWAEALSEEQRWQVISYVRTLSQQ